MWPPQLSSLRTSAGRPIEFLESAVKLKLDNPTGEELKALRSCYDLTQIQAAGLALSSLRAWQGWEGGEHLMHGAIWRYVQIAARALALRMTEAKPQSTIGDDI